jgi:hypothetical protein
MREIPNNSNFSYFAIQKILIALINVKRRLLSRVQQVHNGEEGSLSLLMIGLFVAALSAVMVMTDVAVVANAKRSLDQATEAAAMRAVQNLDEKAYYEGKHTIATSIYMALGNEDYADNRVPIDCNKGWLEVNDEMSSWFNTSSSMKTMQIKKYELTMYDCVYDLVHLEAKAEVKLPFPAPFTDFDRTTINSSITTSNEKDKGLWLFGHRLR